MMPSEFLSPYFWEVLARSGRGAIVVLLLLAVRGVLRNRISAGTRHALWLLVPLALFLPMFPPSMFSVENLTGEPTEILKREIPQRLITMSEPISVENRPTKISVLNPLDGFAEVPIPLTSKTEMRSEMDAVVSKTLAVQNRVSVRFWNQFGIPLLVWTWGTIVVLMLGRMAWKSIAFQRSLGRANRFDPFSAKTVADTQCSAWIRSVKCSVFESPEIASPTLCGLFRPKIVLPAGLTESLEPAQLRHVFLHELAHWRRRDLWFGWLNAIMLTVHWFNPFIWQAVRRMNADREEACDEIALSMLQNEERADYGETLLLLSTQLSDTKKVRIVPGVVGIMESKSFLARRIEAILSARKFSWFAATLAGLAFLVLGVVFLSSAVKRNASPLSLYSSLMETKVETPNDAQITFTKFFRNDEYNRQDRITITGKFVTPNREPLDDAALSGLQSTEFFSGSIGAKVAKDGSFSMKGYDQTEGVVFFKDNTGQWAAPPYTFKTYEPDKTEYTFSIPVFPARHVVATVQDKETGKPLPGIRFEYCPLYGDDFRFGGPKRSRFVQSVSTDAEGKFRYVISTGEYVFGLATAMSNYFSDGFDDEEEKNVFARKITVTEESPEPVEIAFELPKLFTAKLLNPDGSPAKNQTVGFQGYGWNGTSYSTATDDNGMFQVYKTPEYVEMSVNSPDPYRNKADLPRLQLWFAKELATEPEKYEEFRLQKPATIRARFVDADGKPFNDFKVNSFRCCKPGEPATLGNNSHGFVMQKSDIPGEFVFPDATPNVEYHFGGSFPKLRHNARDFLVVTAPEEGKTLDLGDVKIEDPPNDSPLWGLTPKKVPINVFDGTTKINRFDYTYLELYGNGAGHGYGLVSNGDYVQYLRGDERRHWTAFGFRDPSNRWAADPLVVSATEGWDSVTDYRVETVPGEMIRGVVLDEATGKPIDRMPLLLAQKVVVKGNNIPPSNKLTLDWKLATDAQGRFAVRMVPGDFTVGIGDSLAVFGNASPDNRNRKTWTRNFRLEIGKPVELEFRIPTPFVGRVLTASGKPAGDAEVRVDGISRPTSYLRTDDRGEFRLIQAPEPYSYLTFQSSGGDDKAQRLIRWTEPGEIRAGATGTPQHPMEYRLSDIAAVGKMLDAAGNRPKNNTAIYVAAERPDSTPNAAKYQSTPQYFTAWWSLKEDGSFRITGLTPGVKFTLRYNGNPGSDAVIVVPAEKGNTIDLGELRVDGKP